MNISRLISSQIFFWILLSYARYHQKRRAIWNVTNRTGMDMLRLYNCLMKRCPFSNSTTGYQTQQTAIRRSNNHSRKSTPCNMEWPTQKGRTLEGRHISTLLFHKRTEHNELMDDIQDQNKEKFTLLSKIPDRCIYNARDFFYHKGKNDYWPIKSDMENTVFYSYNEITKRHTSNSNIPPPKRALNR